MINPVAPQLLAAAWQSWPQMTVEEAAQVAGLGDVRFVRWFADKPQPYNTPEEFAACSQASSATPDQLGAVNLYTQDDLNFYREFNKALRTGDAAQLCKWQPLARLLIQGLRCLPRKRYDLLLRGAARDLRAVYPVGCRTTTTEFLSTSYNTKGVFLGSATYATSITRTLLIIEGAMGVNILPWSAVPSEAEVLLLPGLEMEVLSCEEVKEMYEFDVERTTYVIRLRVLPSPHSILPLEESLIPSDDAAIERLHSLLGELPPLAAVATLDDSTRRAAISDFRAWRQRLSHSLLVIKGGLGAGKSVFTNHVCKLLSEDKTVVVVRVVFDRNRPTTCADVVRSMARQLVERHDGVLKHLMETMRTSAAVLERIVHERNNESTRLQDVFEVLLASPLRAATKTSATPIYVVLDGLDEHDEAARLAAMLLRLRSDLAAPVLHVVASSRETTELAELLADQSDEGTTIIDFHTTAAAQQDDVRRYLASALADYLSKKKMRMNGDQKNKAVQELARVADANFLAATMLVREMREAWPAVSSPKLLEKLKAITVGGVAFVDQAFAATLQKVWEHVKEYGVEEQTMGKWLRKVLAVAVTAVEPMAVEELVAVTLADGGTSRPWSSEQIAEDQETIEFVVEQLKLLFVCDEVDRKLRLPHPSLKAFLRSSERAGELAVSAEDGHALFAGMVVAALESGVVMSGYLAKHHVEHLFQCVLNQRQNEACEAVVKRLRALMEQRGKEEIAVEEAEAVARLCYDAGWYKGAIELREACGAVWDATKMLDDATMASKLFSLGNACLQQGEHSKALEYYNKSLPILLATLGENHPDTAATYNNMGEVFRKKGEYGKALEYHDESLRILLAALGENHLSTAITYLGIANVYQAKGDVQAKGDTGQAKGDTGQAQSDYCQALKYYGKSLRIMKATVGENHQSTAATYNNMGEVYRKQGNNDKALECHRESLRIMLATLGENHPDTAKTYNNIGEFYRQQDKYEEALEYHRKCLSIRLIVLGENHPDTAATYNNMARCSMALRRTQEAIQTFKLAARIYLQQSPKPWVLPMVIGAICQTLADEEAAASHYKEAQKSAQLAGTDEARTDLAPIESLLIEVERKSVEYRAVALPCHEHLLAPVRHRAQFPQMKTFTFLHTCDVCSRGFDTSATFLAHWRCIDGCDFDVCEEHFKPEA